MFGRYSLRTLDVDRARRFYADVVGLDFSEAADVSGLEAWPLHEQARARGAPPHWLGQLGVADVEGAVSRLVALGAERLGPTVHGPGGAVWATLRDPCGAVVAVREGTAPPSRSRVAFHLLHTRELDRAWATYAELVGWHETGSLEADGVSERVRTFSWEPAGATVGGVVDTARLPGVHPHWLFYFQVRDLDGALARVRESGGKTLAPIALAGGVRLAACDDPQGAAFGLLSST